MERLVNPFVLITLKLKVTLYYSNEFLLWHCQNQIPLPQLFFSVSATSVVVLQHNCHIWSISLNTIGRHKKLLPYTTPMKTVQWTLRMDHLWGPVKVQSTSNVVGEPVTETQSRTKCAWWMPRMQTLLMGHKGTVIWSPVISPDETTEASGFVLQNQSGVC